MAVILEERKPHYIFMSSTMVSFHRHTKLSTQVTHKRERIKSQFLQPHFGIDQQVHIFLIK